MDEFDESLNKVRYIITLLKEIIQCDSTLYKTEASLFIELEVELGRISSYHAVEKQFKTERMKAEIRKAVQLKEFYSTNKAL